MSKGFCMLLLFTRVSLRLQGLSIQVFTRVSLRLQGFSIQVVTLQLVCVNRPSYATCMISSILPR